MKVRRCWACGVPAAAVFPCWWCAAPYWSPSIADGTARTDGVYVIQAYCGLVKIGYSRVVPQRIERLQRDSREPITPLACLRGATEAVEQWLHAYFLDTRDAKAARDAGLPQRTEWFWPTPALARLVRRDRFVDDDDLVRY